MIRAPIFFSGLKGTLAARNIFLLFSYDNFLPPGVFQIIETVPDVLHNDLLFLIDDQTRSFVAEFSAFEQEQVCGKRFRFAIHVRCDLEITLVNDIPRSSWPAISMLSLIQLSIRHRSGSLVIAHALSESCLCVKSSRASTVPQVSQM